MCPNHDVAKVRSIFQRTCVVITRDHLPQALEIRRQKIVKNRATKKTIEYAAAMSRLGK
jgi:hypothetical protein